MKISDHIKHSLDASDKKELDQAMLFACLAVDGTSKKMYPGMPKVGERFRNFIAEDIDILELMFGGLSLTEPERDGVSLQRYKGEDRDRLC